MDIDLSKYKKDTFRLLMEMPNPYQQNEQKKFIRLDYDIADDFTPNQISSLQNFVNEVNIRFPGIKMMTSGGGYVLKEDDENV